MSTAYPTSYDTVTTLYDVVNNASATLAAGYTAGGTTLDLDSASLFPSTGGIIYVGNERTTYTGKTSNQLTGVTALLNNYPSGTAVAMYFDAEHLEVLRDAIIATQARVGVTGDTTAGTLTKRIADLEGAGGETITISNKTSAYTVIAGDLGAIINCTSGTFSVTLTAAATLGAGFNCWVWNSSTVVTDAITIDPAGAETIDGRASLTLYPGGGVQIVCDGANWKAGDNKRPQFYCENTSGALSAPVASGAGSVVVGPRSTASGTRAFAAGYFCTASSTGATAIGQNSSNEGAQAVTGAGAMALGGSYASGTDSFAAAIANNTSTYGAQGANSVAIGSTAKATGTGSFSFGKSAVASGNYALALGSLGTGAGAGALASGASSVAIGDGAKAVEYGKFAYTQIMHAAQGDAQTGMLILAKGTADATATVITSNSGAGSTSNQVILPNNSAYVFDGLFIARRKGSEGTESASWKVEGHLRRDANAASTTLVASTVTAISNVPGWTLALSADTTNGGLAVTFTGAAATNIRTVANIRTVEVTYA